MSASSAPSPSTVKSIRVFIGCVLGAEAELEKELNEVRPLLINSVAQFVTDPWKILNIEKGGVLLETTLLAALQLNYWLKIGNRVLLRLGEFNCTSLPRLRDRFKKIQFPFKGTFEVRAEANRCKVSNEKTILRICEEIWPVEKGSANRVFIRGQMDEWTVSLDSSGEHLHKRGIRKVAGAAPLRETLAALTLRYLCEGQPRSQLLQTVIVDPMAGSGTFILEALTWFQPVKTREFAFEGWQSIPKILKSETFWANYKNHPLLKPLMPFGDLHLIEQDADLLEKVRDQFGKIHGVEFSDVKFQSVEPQDGNFQGVKFHSGRFCDFSTRDQFANHEAKLWVVTNPPYGERIDDKDWLVQFIQWIKQMRPDKIAIWLPLDKSEKIGKMISDAFGSKPDSDKHSKTYQISNGGIRCAIKIF